MPGKGLRAAQVAVCFHPHAADWLPASLGHALFDRGEQFGIILAHEIIKLRLALGEVIFGELLHQAHHGVERASGLAPNLVDRPQPGHVEMRVTGGSNGHVQRRAGLLNSRLKGGMRGRNAGIKGLGKWLAGVQDLERFVQSIEQMAFGWLIGRLGKYI